MLGRIKKFGMGIIRDAFRPYLDAAWQLRVAALLFRGEAAPLDTVMKNEKAVLLGEDHSDRRLRKKYRSAIASAARAGKRDIVIEMPHTVQGSIDEFMANARVMLRWKPALRDADPRKLAAHMDKRYGASAAGGSQLFTDRLNSKLCWILLPAAQQELKVHAVDDPQHVVAIFNYTLALRDKFVRTGGDPKSDACFDKIPKHVHRDYEVAFGRRFSREKLREAILERKKLGVDYVLRVRQESDTAVAGRILSCVGERPFVGIGHGILHIFRRQGKDFPTQNLCVALDHQGGVKPARVLLSTSYLPQVLAHEKGSKDVVYAMPKPGRLCFFRMD